MGEESQGRENLLVLVLVKAYQTVWILFERNGTINGRPLVGLSNRGRSLRTSIY